MMILKYLGINPNRLFLVYGLIRNSSNDAHIVLVVELDSKYYVLDNSYDVGDWLVSASAYCYGFFPKVEIRCDKLEFLAISGNPNSEYELYNSKPKDSKSEIKDPLLRKFLGLD